MINTAITAPITYPKVELTSTGLDVVIKIVAFILYYFRRYKNATESIWVL